MPNPSQTTVPADPAPTFAPPAAGTRRTPVAAVGVFAGVLSVATALGTATPAWAQEFRPDGEGFLRNWVVLGPLPYQSPGPAGVFNAALERSQVADEGKLSPKDGDKLAVAGKNLAWKAMKAAYHQVDFWFELGDTPPNSVGYAATTVVTKDEQKGVRLKVGADDQAKVWLNGAVVLTTDHRNPDRDRFVAEVDLAKGENRIVVKCANASGAWNFCLRFTDKADRPIRNLKAGDGKKEACNEEGFLKRWCIVAPIPLDTAPSKDDTPTANDGGEAIRKNFLPGAKENEIRPKAGDKVRFAGREYVWKAAQCGNHLLDFHGQGVGGDNSVCFAVCYVHSDVEHKEIQVRMGSDDQGRTYVNGREVVSFTDGGRACDKDQNTGTATLNKGVNVIILKVANGNGGFEGCVRFVDKAGRPVTNLKVKTSP